MGLPQGWDFRATSGFVVDPANDDFNGSTANDSGTSSNGIAWNWSIPGSILTRDRNATIDARLAGIIAVPTGTSAAVFTATLPAPGTYDITVAAGDHDNLQTINLDILDNGVLLFSVATNITTAAGNHYIDATGVERTSDTDWVTNNVKKRLTFTTTSAGFSLNSPSGNNSCLCHLKIEAVAAAPAVPMAPRNQSRAWKRMLTR